MYYVQYLQQRWSHLSTQLRCGSSHHRRIHPEFFFNRQDSIIVAGIYPSFCGAHIPTLTLPPQHLLASPSSTCSNSSCDRATHVLSTSLRTVCTTYSIYSGSGGLSFLHSYDVGHRITARVFFNRQDSIIVAGIYPAFCGAHIPTLTLPPQHLLASPSSTC